MISATANVEYDSLPTQRSLLSRLRDLGDTDSWRAFFETYWRLIYSVARKSGFSDNEAQDVLQETVISVARKIPEFRYDPAKGSFKQWLLLITRRRIQDHLRKQYRSVPLAESRVEEFADDPSLACPEPSPDKRFDGIWEEEWREHVFRAALAKVRQQVNAKQFQVFDYSVIKGWSVSRIAQLLGLNSAQVYLAKHRVALVMKRAVNEIEAEFSQSVLPKQ